MDTESAALTTDTAPTNPVAVPVRFDPAPDIYTQAHGTDVWAEMPIAFLSASAPLTVWGGVRAPRIPIPAPTLNPGERLARVAGSFAVVAGAPPRVVAECAVRYDDGYRHEWGGWRSCPWAAVESIVVVPQGTALVVTGPGSCYAAQKQWATILANIGAGVVLAHNDLLADPTLAASLTDAALVGEAGQTGDVVSDVWTSLAIWGAEAAPPAEVTSVTWAAARALAELRAQETSEVAEVAYLQNLVETQLMRLVYENHPAEEAEHIARNFCHLSGSVVNLRALQLAARYGYPDTQGEINTLWDGLDSEERILHSLLNVEQHVKGGTRDTFTRLAAEGHQWRFPQLAQAHEYIYVMRRNEEGDLPWHPPEGLLQRGVLALASAVWRVLYGGRRSP